MTSASVEVIQPADRRRGVAALNLAFASDPWTRWVWPDAYQYATYMPKPQFARRVELGHLLDHGIEVAQDLIGAALGDHLPERCFIESTPGGSHKATAAKFSSTCAVP